MLFAYKLKDPTSVTFIGNTIIARKGSLITTDLQVNVDLTFYGLLEPVRNNHINLEDIILPNVETTIGYDDQGNLRFAPYFLDLEVNDPVTPLPLGEYRALLSAYSAFSNYLKPA